MHPVMIDRPLKVVAGGHIFTEDPRWHAGRLYYSDTTAGIVCALDAKGQLEVVVTLKDHCSGLGFMPNGDLLIVSATERKLLRLGASGVQLHADLSGLTPLAINDMAVDSLGRAYVGDMRFDAAQPLAPQACKMFLVQSDGSVEVAAENLLMGNGTVLSEDGATLIVAETLGNRLSQFSIGEQGRLHDRLVFAQLQAGHYPDGIAQDSAGGIWAACPGQRVVIRVERGGLITHKVPMREGYDAFACVLGGPNRRTLYICTAQSHDQVELKMLRSSCIEAVEVDFAGIGTP